MTDVCVPVSHLPELVTAAKEDAISSNLMSKSSFQFQTIESLLRCLFFTAISFKLSYFESAKFFMRFFNVTEHFFVY